MTALLAACTAVALFGVLACFGVFCHWPDRPRWYRPKHRAASGPGAAHPAARALDTTPSTAPLTDLERWLEADAGWTTKPDPGSQR